MMAPDYKILMYSHDTYGLGHIRRTLTIARALTRQGTDILIITGCPLAGQFCFPRGIDYVRIPGMIKTDRDQYEPLAVRLAPDQVLAIRKEIVLSVVKTFKPDLFIVDKAPLGLKKEIVPALGWIREHLPRTRTVLGLRDVMDDAQSVRASWKRKNLFSAIDAYYDHIWVYGNQEIYDPVAEYNIPPDLTPKLCFTGYLKRQVNQGPCIPKGKKKVLVTAGGGKDGFTLFDAFLSWYEACRPDRVCASMILGPFLGKKEQNLLEKRAQARNISARGFCTDMEAQIRSADLLVCMGGYNTLCEALSCTTPTLVVPRDHPRKEQLIRAQCLSARGLVDYIPPRDLTPEHLGNKITDLLGRSLEKQQAMAGFDMTGIGVIREQVEQFRKAGHP
ncbi:glycosyltransferase family protein [Desulfobacter vibrioformis]|uniref:glycosyltransferase family protein n=1 Tax=Desulfobacter vibrioformis TaxID=34031 RepID=UPI000555D59F|nr:glycosyltransferase [Desulfobacter vibrioformis]